MGLAVKQAAKGLCVPGYAIPTQEGTGWQYSNDMMNVLMEYRRNYPWLWAALDKASGADSGGGSLRAAELLPALAPAERVDKLKGLIKWVKSTPLASRPLVKISVQIVTEEGVKAIQAALPLMLPPVSAPSCAPVCV